MTSLSDKTYVCVKDCNNFTIGDVVEICDTIGFQKYGQLGHKNKMYRRVTTYYKLTCKKIQNIDTIDETKFNMSFRILNKDESVIKDILE